MSVMGVDCRQPIVSIVIPTYNRARLLWEALRSVVEQSFRYWEAIVVDDFSRDGTIRAVASFGDARIRLMQFRSHGVVGVARNVGIGEARGRYVAFLDSDDLWLPHKLNDQVAVLDAHPEVSLVYSVARLFGDTSWRSSACGIMPRPTNAAVDRTGLMRKNVICCSSVTARVEALRAAGGFAEYPDLRAVEDYDLWLRLAEAGKLGFVPRIHVLYRVHAGALSRDAEAMVERTRHLFTLRRLPPDAQELPVRRGWLFKAARYLALEGMTSALYAFEWFGRHTGAGVPMWVER